MDESTLIMSVLKFERVLDAVYVIARAHNRIDCFSKSASDNESVSISQKILRLLLSYTNFLLE